MLPALEISARLRPVDLVARSAARRVDPAGVVPVEASYPVEAIAPYLAVVADLRAPTPSGRLEICLVGDGSRLVGWYDVEAGRVGLEIEGAWDSTGVRRSRRHGSVAAPITAVALTLTGTHLSVLTSDDGRWTIRGRVDLGGRTREETWLRSLRAGHRWLPTAGDPAPLTAVTVGPFGQLGFRDVRFATHADGTAYRLGDRFVLTATHAGPGFFDTGHTGVWSLDPRTQALTHLSDLYFRRPDRPGVFGDHATHLVRDGEQWLVATSTWGDFDRAAPGARVGITLGATHADLLGGQHVLDTDWLPLPTDTLPRCVGVWDPHLARIEGQWHVGFVVARKYFRFHPALAAGPELDALTLRGADVDRVATEGTTLVRVGDGWRVIASDGRDGRRGQRRRYPVFDLAMTEIGELAAPYPSNIPWPSIVPHDDGWLWVSFDGTRYGGPLVTYGTHGDLVLGRSVP